MLYLYFIALLFFFEQTYLTTLVSEVCEHVLGNLLNVFYNRTITLVVMDVAHVAETVLASGRIYDCVATC